MFERTRQNLDIIEKNKQRTISDIMNVFDDLCEDVITEESKEFVSLPEGDPVEVADSAIRMMSRMRHLYQKNPDIFSQERYRERWNKAQAGMDEACRQLEEIRSEEDTWNSRKNEREEVREKIQSIREKIDREKQEYEKLAEAMPALQEELEQTDLRLREAREQELSIKDQLDKELADLADQNEKNREKLEEFRNINKARSDELDQVKQIWNTIWSAYQRDKVVLGDTQNPDEALARTVNEQYNRIMREIDDFRSGYAIVARTIKRNTGRSE